MIKLPSLSTRTKSALLDATDFAFSLVPQGRPPESLVTSARVVAHRGAWAPGSPEFRENTMASFDRAIALGTWGIEFDIRWCMDGLPLIHHDQDAFRVFGERLLIGQTKFDECRKRLPDVPSLEELIARVRGRTHLMIELKGSAAEYTNDRWKTLKRLLSGLEPARDYHLMALDSFVLESCPLEIPNALVPIAEFNFDRLSTLALKNRWAGVTGPYALIGSRAVARHQAAGQKVGTGFVSSRSVLWRELKRGVEWLFTNHPYELIRIMQVNKL